MDGPKMKVDAATVPLDRAANGGSMTYWSMGGGITQFGAYVDVLMPGAASSNRHWHDSEDEFAYILSGQATLIDDDGEHPLAPGDAACWPHGCPNAHHLANDGTDPCAYLIIGSRVAGDICHYPETGDRQINGDTGWSVVDAAGKTLRAGDLPPHLLNMPPVWGTPFNPANPGLRVLSAASGTLPAFVKETTYTHPIIAEHPGPYAYQLLSDPGGLSQFGAFIEELPPGSRSGHRHWHENEDEMIYLLSGSGVLVEHTETGLHPGDVACWPAGVPTGHRMDNRSDQPLRYLVIGTRKRTDTIHYTDHDLVTRKDGPQRRYAHRDGTAYSTGAE
ncbi:MAG: cupin domain-containing protein [Paracoccaceae bacterium]